MNYIDLFHGIGGFALGAYWAGMKFENHFCSDIEKYCIDLYKLRFPNSIQLGDISKIDFEELKNKYGNDWIITGGFPCQDISIAGKGEGINGSRSGLWFEMFRAIRVLRPRFAIIENVSAITFRGLDRVLANLTEIGYNAEWQNIRASDMGAPHRRERIWIVAYTSIERCNKRKQGNNRPLQNEKTNGFTKIYKEIPNADKSRLQKFPLGQFSSIYRENESPQGCKPSRGFAKKKPGNWWSTEPDVGRLAHGIPNRVDRLKGLGNAIVPQIAKLLFEQIKIYF